MNGKKAKLMRQMSKFYVENNGECIKKLESVKGTEHYEEYKILLTKDIYNHAKKTYLNNKRKAK